MNKINKLTDNEVTEIANKTKKLTIEIKKYTCLINNFVGSANKSSINARRINNIMITIKSDLEDLLYERLDIIGKRKDKNAIDFFYGNEDDFASIHEYIKKKYKTGEKR